MTDAVLIKIDPVKGRIRGSISKEVKDRLHHVCSYEVPDAQYIIGAAKGRHFTWGREKTVSEWDGRQSLFHRGTNSFPVGLLTRVLEVLQDRLVKYKVVEVSGTEARVEYPAPGEEWGLRPYQMGVVNEALRSQRGMIRVATGGGKTVIAGWLIYHTSQRTVFFVHTKDLLYQAIESFRSMFGEDRVGQIGDGVVDIRDITVCTLQTMARALGAEVVFNEYEEDDQWADDERITSLSKARAVSFLNGCGLVVMDECHRVAAPTAQKVVQAAKNPVYRFGLSASPWRDDGADIVLEGIFGDVICTVSASDLIRQDYLVPPYIRVLDVPGRVYTKGTRYDIVYKDYIVENEDRNQLGVSAAARLIRRGVQTMILVRYISHGREIQERMYAHGIDIPFLSGQDDSTTRNVVIQGLREQKLPGIIATTIADEGLDIKPLGGLVLLGGGKSSTRALQRVGRVLRPFSGKTHAEVVDFNDNALYLANHTIAREKLYATEPEFVVVGL